MSIYRSAISAYHPQVDDVKVGQHPLVQQFMKGAFNLRPPQAKYSETWEVSRVLRHIKTMGKNEDMSLKDLTLKLTMLAALTMANRAHELSSLSTAGMLDKGDSLVFTLTKPSKLLWRNMGQVLKNLSLHELKDRHRDPLLALLFKVVPGHMWVTNSSTGLTPADGHTELFVHGIIHQPNLYVELESPEAFKADIERRFHTLRLIVPELPDFTRYSRVGLWKILQDKMTTVESIAVCRQNVIGQSVLS